MQIFVVRNQNEPADPADGEMLWYGGDGVDGLSGSILREFVPDLDVGSWYLFAAFEQAILEPAPPADGVWTSVEVRLSGVAGPSETRIEIEQLKAAALICRAVVDHVKQFGDTEHVWIRVE
jgi:hypothetical protein